MKKHKSDARKILSHLGNLSAFLKDLDADADKDDCFNYPLEIIHKTMMLDVCVLYKVSNVIEDMLILEIAKVLDPTGSRLDLREGRKLRIYLDARDKRYINEVNAFKTKTVSCIHVPGLGCDIIGYVYFPKNFGGAYLFGGDFLGKQNSIKNFEVSTVEILCNFLSTILLKTQFKQQAEVDHLTGLYNSGKIKAELDRVVKRLDRKPGTPVSIAMGDIDYFKKINDTYGHIQGDMVLKEVGNILTLSMREYFDMAGRYGGEEFLLIFDETDEENAMMIVERIRKTIQAFKFKMVNESEKRENNFLNITMSFGVVSNHSDPGSPMDWISRADKALYASKQNGRNRTTLCKGERCSE